MWASGVAPAGGQSYVDRGNKNGDDWNQASGLTISASWNVLDMSAVVPAAAAGKLVLLRLKFQSGGIGHPLWIKSNDHANDGNSYENASLIATTNQYDQVLVPCDVDRKIKYWIQTATTSLTVRGWWE